MPRETIDAFLDHGRVERTLDRELDEARRQLDAVEALGISMRQVTDELVTEGVAAFAKSHDELLATISRQRQAVGTA
jgi:transaldolase